MPALTDRDSIRSLLEADSIWSVYALGDLLPALFPHTRWFTPDLTLVLQVHDACILFAHGSASVSEALRHVRWPVHLQVREPALAVVAAHARVTRQKRMWRMGWQGGPLEPGRAGHVRRLTMADLPALQRLYADGEASSEAPDFFYPSMLADGVFSGAFTPEGELAAAAGTHIYAPEEGAAAIGNVYTRRSQRGRGYGRAATGATLAAVAHLPTVGLNVRWDNAPAIHVYESLGFRKHCVFYEALAEAPATTAAPD